MITCPNCNHQNPEGSVQCESCYTPLSSTSPCPNCGAVVQTDATFCGQCGFNLQGKINISQTASGFYRENLANSPQNETHTPVTMNADLSQSPWDIADETEIEDLPEIDEQLLSYSAEELEQSSMSSLDELEKELEQPSMTPFGEVGEIDELPSNFEETEDLETWITSVREESLEERTNDLEEIPELSTSQELESVRSNLTEDAANLGFSVSEPEIQLEPEIEPEPSIPQSSEPSGFTAIPTTNDSSQSLTTNDVTTQIQIQQAVLLHLQTGNKIEFPPDLAVVRIGKPNKQIPPDIDVSSFPNSEIVSRIHADIRIEGDTYFIEDRGSSNGTYINHSPLLAGNRHRLRTGDRLSLGKGDLMTFIFQLN